MKSYNQICGVSTALDMIGDRWTLLIIRDLLVGPMTYGEILCSLEGITTNLLALRLKKLIKNKLVARSDSGKRGQYYLTDFGKTLEGVIFALGSWGFSQIDFKKKSAKRSLRWAALSLRRRLTARGRNYSVTLAPSDGKWFRLGEVNGTLYAEETNSCHADFVLLGNMSEIMHIIAGRTTKLTKDQFQGDINVWHHLLEASV